MRILQIGNVQSIHMQRWATALAARGHEVHVASLLPGECRGASIHLLRRLPIGKVGYLAAVPALRSLWKTLRPDVCHAQYVTSYGLLSALAGLKPLVVTAWGSDVLISPRTSFLARQVVRFALGKAEAVTTVAQHMTDALDAIGVHRNDVETSPFGVDLDLFALRRSDGADAGVTRLVSTRNLMPVYDVGTLIKAVSTLVGSGARIELDVVGDGPERGRLETLAASLGIAGSVRFLGRVEHRALPGILARADIFVSTALSDGNNISLNEAMACGVFPIATQIPANSQWLEAGRNGLLFRRGDAVDLASCIRSAIGDPGFRSRAIAINREIVEASANWSRCVSQMVATYHRIARQSGEDLR